jgi:hypothetical protein
MFHQQDYDLSRQKYQEYTASFEGQYVPMQDNKPSFVRQLLAALGGASRERTPHCGVKGKSHHAGAGVAAK